mmetsp:Transcript_8756/g.10800  ORF Transcript_8756/g.10800 Transcript_8756/m.10800 type:complete len:106 (-) Transcript_8756:288-605(-)
MVKDEEEIKYYQHWVADINCDAPAREDNGVPQFASASTSWKYIPMKEVRELCKSGDTQKPNFLQLAIKRGYISESRADQGANCKLTPGELKQMDKVIDNYYQDNW